MRVLLIGSVLVLALASACGGDDDDDDDDVVSADAAVDVDAAGDVDASAALSIPDPGTANADWGFTVGFGEPCCSDPSTAYPVGIVTAHAGYVQGDIDDADHDFFYVFKTGPAYTEFVWTGGIDMNYLHLHEGAGLVFGAEVPATVSTPSSGTWPVSPNTIYVLELNSNTGGFF